MISLPLKDSLCYVLSVSPFKEDSAVITFAGEHGLFSGLANRPVLPSLVICGRVVMSGSMMPITSELDEIFVAAINAGAKRIMLPVESSDKYDKLKPELKNAISAIFYSTPLDAAKKALGVD